MLKKSLKYSLLINFSIILCTLTVKAQSYVLDSIPLGIQEIISIFASFFDVLGNSQVVMLKIGLAVILFTIYQLILGNYLKDLLKDKEKFYSKKNDKKTSTIIALILSILSVVFIPLNIMQLYIDLFSIITVLLLMALYGFVVFKEKKENGVIIPPTSFDYFVKLLFASLLLVIISITMEKTNISLWIKGVLAYFVIYLLISIIYFIIKLFTSGPKTLNHTNSNHQKNPKLQEEPEQPQNNSRPRENNPPKQKSIHQPNQTEEPRTPEDLRKIADEATKKVREVLEKLDKKDKVIDVTEKSKNLNNKHQTVKENTILRAIRMKSSNERLKFVNYYCIQFKQRNILYKFYDTFKETQILKETWSYIYKNHKARFDRDLAVFFVTCKNYEELTNIINLIKSSVDSKELLFIKKFLINIANNSKNENKKDGLMQDINNLFN
ncbi:APC family permease [Candidatus Woesearchaeota archaeon]|nr:APC family permease [Candidatus Woesearchaeota archaeon]